MKDNQPEPELVSLPFHYIAELLLFNPPPHLPSRSISRGPYELGDPYPSIIRRDIGVILKHFDPDEQILTIFIYPHHAEVWSAREWRESNVHRLKLVTSQEKYQRDLEASQEAERKYNSRLEFYMKYLHDVLSMSLKDGKTTELAKKLVKLEDITDLADFPGLKEYKLKQLNQKEHLANK